MGSVRSCRIYYCAFANEWDAIYSHFGQSKYALDYLKSGSIDKVGSLNAESAFYRTSDRVAPHNCFTSGKGLDSAIKKFKYRTSYKKKYTSHFNFAKSGSKIALDSKKTAKKVEIGYRINHPYFVYNKKDGQYYRYQYNQKHIDDQNKKQLHCSNIIVQFVNYTLYPDNKSLDITLTGKGSGWFITNGKAEKITWSGRPKYPPEKQTQKVPRQAGKIFPETEKPLLEQKSLSLHRKIFSCRRDAKTPAPRAGVFAVCLLGERENHIRNGSFVRVR